MLKSILIRTSSSILACAAVFYLAFCLTGFSYNNGVETTINILIMSGLVYFLCLLLSPWVAVGLAMGSRMANTFFYIFLLVTVSGGLLLLIPLLDILTGALSVFILAALPSFALSVYLTGERLMQSANSAIQSAYERGLKRSYIIRNLLFKTALSLFFKNTGKLLAFIAAAYTVSEVLINKINLPAEFFGQIAVTVILSGLCGFAVHKIMSR